MRKTISKVFASLALPIIFAGAAMAQSSDVYSGDRGVCKSSGTIPIVLVSSYTPTLVDTPQIEGSFAVEIQNRDASNKICCAFDVAFTTTTTAHQKGCRELSAATSTNAGGAWVVQRWWQNLRLYCQSLSTTGTSPVAVTQCR